MQTACIILSAFTTILNKDWFLRSFDIGVELVLVSEFVSFIGVSTVVEADVIAFKVTLMIGS